MSKIPIVTPDFKSKKQNRLKFFNTSEASTLEKQEKNSKEAASKDKESKSYAGRFSTVSADDSASSYDINGENSSQHSNELISEIQKNG